MQAWVQRRYGGIEALSFEELALPEPGAGEVRVKVLACGANASDWELLTGFPFYARIFGLRKPPALRVLGSDIVGVVDKLGPGVHGLGPGQRVLADTHPLCGGFSEYAVAAQESWVAVPDGLDDVQAAALPQSGTIALTAFKGRVRAGTRVLINGAGGGSGTLALQLAKAAGGVVTVVDNATKSALLRELGADRVLDYHALDFTTEHAQYDLILDLFGTRPMVHIKRVLAPGGRYMLVGGWVRTLVAAAASSLVPPRLTDRSCGVLAVRQGPAHLAELMQLTLDRTLRPQIGEVVPLSDAARALERMGTGRIPGKLVVRTG